METQNTRKKIEEKLKEGCWNAGCESDERCSHFTESEIKELVDLAKEEERGEILNTIEQLPCHKHGGVLPNGKIPAAILVSDILSEFDKKWPLVETEMGDDHPYLSLREIRGYFIDELENALHHQLQKVRHVWLREEIVNLKEEILDAELHYDMRGMVGTKMYCSALQTIIDRYHSELDQDTELLNSVKEDWNKQAENAMNGLKK